MAQELQKRKTMRKADAWYSFEPDKIAGSFEVEPERGLNNSEVSRRVEKYGKNILEKVKQKSPLLIFLDQFNNPIVWILIAAAALAFVSNEITEGLAVIIVVILNTLIGFLMELQAVRSMEKLRSMARSKARVIREGKTVEIDSADIVPGDILYIEAGDVVTADARIISINNLAVKEAALTGESDAVDKNTDALPEDTRVADRRNSLFKGTIVTRGNGKAIVTATGDETELGRIADITHKAKKEITPLNKRLDALSKRLIWLTLGIAALILLTGILYGKTWEMMIETAVALAVASIPEGLPVISTITLARGMRHLARKKVIVKTLEAVQTLGETEVIFTDKTGTLTENEMFVTVIASADGTEELNGKEKKEQFNKRPDLEAIQAVAVLCNNSSYHEKGKEKSSGDPVEIALLRMVAGLSGSAPAIRRKYHRLAEIPFDADLKMMGTLNKSEDEYLICAKGATEELLQACSGEWVKGKQRKLTSHDEWIRKTNELSDEGLKVLGFAHRVSKKKPGEDNFIKELAFLGLIGFIDPVRSGIRESIQEFRNAGIRVIMITGDHPGTAAAIAKEAGLSVDDDNIITGKDLAKATGSGTELRQRVLNATTFARVDPSQKLDLIMIYQKKKIVVGMTGDGVNDAPALKKADIGIAMGKRGTEAAKEAADLILQNDAFSSIVTAVKQGRIIFRNIQAFVIYLLSCNMSEVMIVGIAALLNLPFPLLPMQILFLNMVTDIFPALAIGLNAGEKDVMKSKPKKSSEPILSNKHWVSLITYAGCITASVLGVEACAIYLLELDERLINNLTFYTLVLAQLLHVFNMPERTVSFFRNQFTKNPYTWYALILCLIIQLSFYLIPQTREMLSLASLNPVLLLLVIAGGSLPVILVQVLKRGFKVIQ